MPSGTIATIAIILFFFFPVIGLYFFLINIYVSCYIYCYIDTTNFTTFSQLLTCVNALKHGSYSALVSWATFFPKFWIVTTVPSGTIATVATFFFFSVIGFFFPFKYLCKLVLYCYTDTTNFTIFSQLLTCQFLTSRNKIIKYEIVTNHN